MRCATATATPGAPGRVRTWCRAVADRVVRDESGNSLMLYPFAVLVVLALGGIALDTAVLFQAHRETVDVAAGLASDVAGLVDEQAFAEQGVVRIDGDRAGTLVTATNRDLVGHPNGLRCSARIRPADPATVDVVCTGSGQAILLPITGLAGDIQLRGASSASAVG